MSSSFPSIMLAIVALVAGALVFFTSWGECRAWTRLGASVMGYICFSSY